MILNVNKRAIIAADIATIFYSLCRHKSSSVAVVFLSNLASKFIYSGGKFKMYIYTII